MNYDKSTADGQKRMFYEVASEIGSLNAARMYDLCYQRGYEAGMGGKDIGDSTHPGWIRGWNDGQRDSSEQANN